MRHAPAPALTLLSNWRGLAIFGQCRRAMLDHGKLLVAELVLLGGRERTAAEYDTLFQATGFKLALVIPTPPGPSVVEAVPA
jgi:hypothetical protein